MILKYIIYDYLKNKLTYYFSGRIVNNLKVQCRYQTILKHVTNLKKCVPASTCPYF